MSKQFPDWVDPWTAAEGRRQFAGSLGLGAMDRLAPLLASGEGEAAFQARFRLDGERRPEVTVTVDARVWVTCQVSMEAFELRLQSQSTLVVVGSDAEQDELPPTVDTTLAQGGRLGFSSLVEDELLLALPQVPRKPEYDIAQRGAGDGAKTDSGQGREPGAGSERTHRPFAELGTLMEAVAARRKSSTDTND